MKKNNLLKIILVVTVSAATFAGCGHPTVSTPVIMEEEADPLKDFAEALQGLSVEFAGIDEEIEAAGSSMDIDRLSHNLDELQSLYQKVYNLEYPEEYASLHSVAEEGLNYMKEANSYFQDILESNEISSEQLTAKYEYASENLNRASKRLKVIFAILSGDA